jgi:hypothetical protein
MRCSNLNDSFVRALPSKERRKNRKSNEKQMRGTVPEAAQIPRHARGCDDIIRTYADAFCDSLFCAGDNAISEIVSSH